MELTKETWLQDERMIYALHNRKSRELCNKFQMTVSPDFGSDLTNKDAEAVASQIVTRLNSFDDLLEACEWLLENYGVPYDIETTTKVLEAKEVKMLDKIELIINKAKGK